MSLANKWRSFGINQPPQNALHKTAIINLVFWGEQWYYLIFPPLGYRMKVKQSIMRYLFLIINQKTQSIMQKPAV